MIDKRKKVAGLGLGRLLDAVDSLRHRVRHRLVMMTAYGIGYGAPEPSDTHMAPWEEDPATPLSSKSPERNDAASAASRRHNVA